MYAAAEAQKTMYIQEVRHYSKDKGRTKIVQSLLYKSSTAELWALSDSWEVLVITSI